ncbi:MAG: zinc ABC transporter substrate-binding protein, partial [Elusimicrobia bacterium]|nr:zinc ABC transporter substrate-binding protein [Elusimicrobiota bacterium]
TTTEDLAAIAREVGGDKVEVTALAKGYQDPHFVDAKPSYLIKLQRASLFIEIGRDLEAGWAPSLLNSARNPNILAGASGFLDASALVPILEISQGQVSRAQGDVHPFGNPHYWMDPKNGEFIADAIQEKLSNLSPADADYFHSRLEDFKKRLETALSGWQKKGEDLGLPGMKVVTYHKSWSYFAKRFGLEVMDFVEPRPGIPPSPQHIRSLIAKMKSSNVKLVIVDPYFDLKLPQKIAQDADAKLAVLPTSVGAEKDIPSYFDLFDRQLKIIEQVLKGGRK